MRLTNLSDESLDELDEIEPRPTLTHTEGDNSILDMFAYFDPQDGEEDEDCKLFEELDNG